MTEPTAAIDLCAYRRNLARLTARVAPATIMAVVKADAYGHGLLPVAGAAVQAGVGWIGALDIETALELRESGIPHGVAVFVWLLGAAEAFAPAIEAAIDFGVSSLAQLEQIALAVGTTRARVHLKIDTGLHRSGASAEEWPALVSRAVELSDRVETVGLWTHIAEASEREDSVAIARFRSAIAIAEGLGAPVTVRHLAASAAAFERADARFDLVRIGAFSYGISPGGGVTPFSLGLEPVMTLTAPVLAVRDGLATVGIGYGDGIPSSAAGVMHVAIDGKPHRIVSVDLETLTVDVGGDQVSPDDSAVLFGGGDGVPTLQEWGDKLGTIGEEIVSRLSPRIPRRYLG